MALRRYTVPVPQKHTSADKSGKYPYVYHRSNYRRNAKGKPTHDRTLIGKLDPENPGLMFPNDNYYKIYPHEEDREYQLQRPSRISSCGVTLFLSLLSARLGITELLEKIFPRCSQEILQIAVYMVCRGNVMMYLDDFYEEHHPVYNNQPGSRHLSEVFESIDTDSIRNFMEAWQELASGGQREAICYDVTSISTAGGDIDLAERGYNQDHERLSQIHVAMFYSQTSQLPLYYEQYSRSISDLSYWEMLMKRGKELHLGPGFIVLDPASPHRDDIQHLKELRIPFAMTVTGTDPVFREALLTHSDAARDRDSVSLRTGTGSVQREIWINGERFQLGVYHDREKEAGCRMDPTDFIERRERELRGETAQQTRKHRETGYLAEEETEQTAAATRKLDMIREDDKILGVFGILSYGISLTADEILLGCRRRDGIERSYDNMKNHLDFYRLRIRSDQAMQGKFFVAFIAQILYADLSRKLWSPEIDPKMLPVETVNKLLMELEKIKLVRYGSGNELFQALTRKQKNILSLFGISAKEFISEAGKLKSYG